jgi:hypothetical protein
MKDYELINSIKSLINSIKSVVETDGEKITDGECLDRIIELVEEYVAFNFDSEVRS